MEKLIDYLASSEITLGYNAVRDHITPLLIDFFQSKKIENTLK